MALKDTTYKNDDTKLKFNGGTSTSLKYNADKALEESMVGGAGVDYFNDKITEIDGSGLGARIGVSIVGGTGNLEKITTGAGKDSIKIGADSSVTELNAGDGNNSVDIQKSEQVKVTLGKGNDSLTVSGNASVTGGAGNDLYIVQPGATLVIADYSDNKTGTKAGTDKIQLKNSTASQLTHNFNNGTLTIDVPGTTTTNEDDTEVEDKTTKSTITINNLEGQKVTILDSKNNTIFDQQFGGDGYKDGTYKADANNTGSVLHLNEDDGIKVIDASKHSKALLVDAPNIANGTQGVSVITAAGADTIEITSTDNENAATVTSGKGKDVIMVNAGVNLVLTDFDFTNDVLQINPDFSLKTNEATNKKFTANVKDETYTDLGDNDVLLTFEDETDDNKKATVQLVNGLWDGVASKHQITIVQGRQTLNSTGVSDPTKRIISKIGTQKNMDFSDLTGNKAVGLDSTGTEVKYNYQTMTDAGVTDFDYSNVSNSPITVTSGAVNVIGTKKADTIIGAADSLETPVEGTAAFVLDDTQDVENAITGKVVVSTVPEEGGTADTVGELEIKVNLTDNAITGVEYDTDHTATDITPASDDIANDAEDTESAEKADTTPTVVNTVLGTFQLADGKTYTIEEVVTTTYKEVEGATSEDPKTISEDETTTTTQVFNATREKVADVDDNGDFIITSGDNSQAYNYDDDDENNKVVTWTTTTSIDASANKTFTVEVPVDSSSVTGHEGTAVENASVTITLGTNKIGDTINKFNGSGEVVQDSATITDLLSFDIPPVYAYDNLASGGSAGYVDGGVGNDVFFGAKGGVLKGGDGNDTFRTGAASAADEIAGKTGGTVTFTGGAGNDAYIISGSQNLTITDYSNTTDKDTKAKYGQDQITFANDAYNQKSGTPLAARVRITNSSINDGNLALNYSGQSYTDSLTSKNAPDNDKLSGEFSSASGAFTHSVKGTVTIQNVTSAETGTLTVTHAGTKYTLAGSDAAKTDLSSGSYKNFLAALAPNATKVSASGMIDLSGSSQAIALTGAATGKDTIIGNGNSTLDGNGGTDLFIAASGDTLKAAAGNSNAQVAFASDYFDNPLRAGINISSVTWNGTGASTKQLNVDNVIIDDAVDNAVTFVNNYKTITVKNGKVTEKTATDLMTRTFSTNAEATVEAGKKDTYLKVFAGIDDNVTLVKSGAKVVNLDVQGKKVESILGGNSGEYIKVGGQETGVITTVTSGKGNDTISAASNNIVVTDFQASKFTNGAYKSGDVLDLSGLSAANAKTLIADGSIEEISNYKLEFVGQDAIFTNNGNKVTLAGAKANSIAVAVEGGDIIEQKLDDPLEYYETENKKKDLTSIAANKTRIDTTKNTKGENIAQIDQVTQILTGKGVDTIALGLGGYTKDETGIETAGKVNVNTGDGADLIVINPLSTEATKGTATATFTEDDLADSDTVTDIDVDSEVVIKVADESGNEVTKTVKVTNVEEGESGDKTYSYEYEYDIVANGDEITYNIQEYGTDKIVLMEGVEIKKATFEPHRTKTGGTDEEPAYTYGEGYSDTTKNKDTYYADIALELADGRTINLLKVPTTAVRKGEANPEDYKVNVQFGTANKAPVQALVYGRDSVTIGNNDGTEIDLTGAGIENSNGNLGLNVLVDEKRTKAVTIVGAAAGADISVAENSKAAVYVRGNAGAAAIQAHDEYYDYEVIDSSEAPGVINDIDLVEATDDEVSTYGDEVSAAIVEIGDNQYQLFYNLEGKLVNSAGDLTEYTAPTDDSADVGTNPYTPETNGDDPESASPTTDPAAKVTGVSIVLGTDAKGEKTGSFLKVAYDDDSEKYYSFSVAENGESATLTQVKQVVSAEAQDAKAAVDDAITFTAGAKNDYFAGQGSSDTIDLAAGGNNTLSGLGRIKENDDDEDAVAVVKAGSGADTFILSAGNQASIEGYAYTGKNQDKIYFDKDFKADITAAEIKTNGTQKDLVLTFSDEEENQAQVTLAAYDGESIYTGQISTNNKGKDVLSLNQQVSFDYNSSNKVTGVKGSVGNDKISIFGEIREISVGKGNDTVTVDFDKLSDTTNETPDDSKTVTITDFEVGKNVLNLKTVTSLTDLSGDYIYDGGTTATLVSREKDEETDEETVNYVVLQGAATKDTATKTNAVRFASANATSVTRGVALQNNVNITATGSKGYENFNFSESNMDFTQSVNGAKYKGSSGISIVAGTNFQAFTASAYEDKITLSADENSKQVAYNFTSQSGKTDTLTFKLGTDKIKSGTKSVSQLGEINYSGLNIGSVTGDIGSNNVTINFVTTAKSPKAAGSLKLIDDAQGGGNFKYSVQFTTTEEKNETTGAMTYEVTAQYFVEVAALGKLELGDPETSGKLNKADAVAWTSEHKVTKGQATSSGQDAYISYNVVLVLPDDAKVLAKTQNELDNLRDKTASNASGYAAEPVFDSDDGKDNLRKLEDTNLNIIVKHENGKYSIDSVIYYDSISTTTKIVEAADGTTEETVVKALSTLTSSNGGGQTGKDGFKVQEDGSVVVTLFGGQGLDGAVEGSSGLYTATISGYEKGDTPTVKYSYDYNQTNTFNTSAYELGDTTVEVTRELQRHAAVTENNEAVKAGGESSKGKPVAGVANNSVSSTVTISGIAPKLNTSDDGSGVTTTTTTSVAFTTGTIQKKKLSVIDNTTDNAAPTTLTGADYFSLGSAAAAGEGVAAITAHEVKLNQSVSDVETKTAVVQSNVSVAGVTTQTITAGDSGGISFSLTTSTYADVTDASDNVSTSATLTGTTTNVDMSAKADVITTTGTDGKKVTTYTLKIGGNDYYIETNAATSPNNVSITKFGKDKDNASDISTTSAVTIDETSFKLSENDGLKIEWAAKVKQSDKVEIGGQTYNVTYGVDDFGNSNDEIIRIGTSDFKTSASKVGTFTIAADGTNIARDTTFTLDASNSTLTWDVTKKTGEIKFSEEVKFDIAFAKDIFGNAKSSVTSIGGVAVGTDGTFQITSDQVSGIAASTTFTYSVDGNDDSTAKLTWKGTEFKGTVTFSDDNIADIVYDKDVFGNSKSGKENIVSIGGQTFATDGTIAGTFQYTTASDTSIAEDITFSLNADMNEVSWAPIQRDGYILFGTDDNGDGTGKVTIAYGTDMYGNSTNIIESVTDAGNNAGHDEIALQTVAAAGDDNKVGSYQITFGTGTYGESGSTATLSRSIVVTLTGNSSEDITDTTKQSGSASWTPVLNTTGFINFDTSANKTYGDNYKFNIVYGKDDFGNNNASFSGLQYATDTNTAPALIEIAADSKFSIASQLGTDVEFAFVTGGDSENQAITGVSWLPAAINGGTVTLAGDDIFKIVYATDVYGNNTYQIDSLVSSADINTTLGVTYESGNIDTGTFTIVADKNNNLGHDVVITVDNTKFRPTDTNTDNDKETFTWNTYGRSGRVTLDGEYELDVEFGTDAYGNSTSNITKIGTFTPEITDGTFEIDPDSEDKSGWNFYAPDVKTNFTISGLSNADDNNAAVVTWNPSVQDADSIKLGTNEGDTYVIAYDVDNYGNSVKDKITKVGNIATVMEENNTKRTLTVTPSNDMGAAVDTKFTIGSDNEFTYIKSTQSDDTFDLNESNDTTGETGKGLKVIYGTDAYGNDDITKIVSIKYGDTNNDVLTVESVESSEADKLVYKFTDTNSYIDSEQQSGRDYTVTIGTDSTGTLAKDEIKYNARVQTKEIKVPLGIGETSQTGTGKFDTYTIYYKANGFGDQLNTLDIDRVEVVKADKTTAQTVTLGEPDGKIYTFTSDDSSDNYTITFDSTQGGEELTYTVAYQKVTETTDATVTKGDMYYADSTEEEVDGVRWLTDFNDAITTTTDEGDDTTEDETPTTSNPFMERAFAETTKLYDDFITADVSDLSSITTKTYNEAAITADLTTDFSRKRGIILNPLTSSLTSNKKKN